MVSGVRVPRPVTLSLEDWWVEQTMVLSKRVIWNRPCRSRSPARFAHETANWRQAFGWGFPEEMVYGAGFQEGRA